jgi:hypothetical protein
VAGPWFTVQRDSSDWHTLDTLWLSNGEEDIKARVEVRVSLEPLPGAEANDAASR